MSEIMFCAYDDDLYATDVLAACKHFISVTTQLERGARFPDGAAAIFTGNPDGRYRHQMLCWGPQRFLRSGIRIPKEAADARYHVALNPEYARSALIRSEQLERLRSAMRETNECLARTERRLRASTRRIWHPSIGAAMHAIE